MSDSLKRRRCYSAMTLNYLTSRLSASVLSGSSCAEPAMSCAEAEVRSVEADVSRVDAEDCAATAAFVCLCDADMSESRRLGSAAMSTGERSITAADCARIGQVPDEPHRRLILSPKDRARTRCHNEHEHRPCHPTAEASRAVASRR